MAEEVRVGDVAAVAKRVAISRGSGHRFIPCGATRFEVFVCSLATFGELKKLLTAEKGLQPADQRLLYLQWERKMGRRVH
ncbi:hypothetical protein OPV22_004880 [Ensete ventricosum]|uniref:Ubiquitin-like domain-containing protein n=1 Tax=Ensete ventricosum TaxID=4639 RepID=A0AAV8RJS6_ENSVE|nr:hypothetical protein OPV22_004880 [Ensete ventricosum]